MKRVKYWAAEVQYDKENDDYFIEFPPLFLEELGWKEGDDIVFEVMANGKIRMTKMDDLIDEDVGC
jgi:hypothetical protein